MARTADEIVEEYVNYIEEQRWLSQQPTRTLEGTEAARVAAEFKRQMELAYPNGIDAAEVEVAADRWEETQNVAEAFLDLMDKLDDSQAELNACRAAGDQKDAKIAELQDDSQRKDNELDCVRNELTAYKELVRYWHETNGPGHN